MRTSPERNPLVSRCLRLLSLTVAALLLGACASVVETDGPHRPAKTVLVITGAGMVPYAANDPRYESMWLQVATQFAKAANSEISKGKTRGQLHIKQNRSEATDAAVTRLVGADRREAVLQVSMRHVKSSSENAVYLTAEFLPLEFKRYSNGKKSITPAPGLAKNYPMFSTTGKDLSKASISDLAKEFVRELRTQGHIL